MAEPFRLPLPSGLFALIDAEDADRICAHRWHLKRRKSKPNELYVQRTVRLGSGRLAPKTAIVIHREVMRAQPYELIDHRNGNGLDNRKENLRRTDTRGNARNIHHAKNRRAGGFKGVSFNKNAGKWEAGIGAGPLKANGKHARLYLGLFDEAADAARAYDAAALKHFGEFAALNFPISPAANEETEATHVG